VALGDAHHQAQVGNYHQVPGGPVPEIDPRRLVGLLSEIFNAFLSGRSGKREPREILDSLTLYTVEHFSDEEAWMRAFNYPQREQHVLEHSVFVSRISEFRSTFQERTGQLTLDIISYLRVWLLSHISVSDFDLGVFQREIRSEEYGGANAALRAAL
jgi:hemerythrin-like metal-binding protein